MTNTHTGTTGFEDLPVQPYVEAVTLGERGKTGTYVITAVGGDRVRAFTQRRERLGSRPQLAHHRGHEVVDRPHRRPSRREHDGVVGVRVDDDHGQLAPHCEEGHDARG